MQTKKLPIPETRPSLFASALAAGLAAAMLAWPALGADADGGSGAADAAAETAPSTAGGVRVDGAEKGEWTHDWDAAVAAARRDGVPLFVDFTGSDWCGWCMLLKAKVFSEKEWRDWAKDNVYLVHLDFPQDPSLVPEKYRARNGTLAQMFGVRGFPTCLLVDPGSLSPLGRFGASRDVTAASFVAQVSAAMPR